MLRLQRHYKPCRQAPILDRISGGKFVESWDQYDALGMMRQIGAIPELEQATEI